jgi:hypothetical protein
VWILGIVDKTLELPRFFIKLIKPIMPSSNPEHAGTIHVDWADIIAAQAGGIRGIVFENGDMILASLIPNQPEESAIGSNPEHVLRR